MMYGDMVNESFGIVIIYHLFTQNLKIQFIPHEEPHVSITNV
jgi:hypothetical protein